MVKRFISNPISSIKLINIVNLKTLIFAINNEDHNIIISNLDKKILEHEHSYVRTIHFQDKSKVNVQISDARTFSSVKIIIYGWFESDKKVEKISLLNGSDTISTFYFLDQLPAAHHAKSQKKFFFEEDISSPLIDRNNFILKFSSETTDSCDVPIKTYESYDYSRLTWNTQYRIYKQKNALTLKKLKILNSELEHLEIKPLITIVVPVYNTQPDLLRECVHSVVGQIYENWELILSDDSSSNSQTLRVLREIENSNPKIKVLYGKKNKRISEATNAAIHQATGRYIGFLDHDDTLSREALVSCVKCINEHNHPSLIYSDEDLIDIHGFAVSPMLKPGFSLDLLRCTNYMNHFCLVKKSVGDSLGWLRKEYDGAQDYDLLLRIVDSVSHDTIKHIPKILYHWRKNKDSITDNPSEKKYVFANGKNALKEHLKRNNITGEIKKGKKLGTYYINYELDQQPLVSIIIPFRDRVSLLKTCLKSIKEKTRYEKYEIILVDNRSIEYETRNYLKSLEIEDNITVLKYNEEFNYSAINNFAVNQSKGEYILLLNNDIEVITEGWIKHLMNFGLQERVGAVGALLLYPDQTIQHEGVTFGYTNKKISFPFATHINKHFEVYNSQRFMPHVVRNVSGVTAACMFLRKEYYVAVNGLDEENLKIAFNDVDLCFKLADMGLTVVINPYVQAIHYESKSRGYNITLEQKKREKKEFDYLHNKWFQKFSETDTYLNDVINISNDRMNLM